MDSTLPRPPSLSTTSAVFIPEHTGPQDSNFTRVRVSEHGTDPYAITRETIGDVPYDWIQPIYNISTLVEVQGASELLTTGALDSPRSAMSCTKFGPGATHTFYVPPINADGQRVIVDYWGMDLEDQGLIGTPDNPETILFPGRQTRLKIRISDEGTNAGSNLRASKGGFKLEGKSDAIKKEDQGKSATSDVRVKEEPQD